MMGKNLGLYSEFQEHTPHSYSGAHHPVGTVLTSTKKLSEGLGMGCGRWGGGCQGENTSHELSEPGKCSTFREWHCAHAEVRGTCGVCSLVSPSRLGFRLRPLGFCAVSSFAHRANLPVFPPHTHTLLRAGLTINLELLSLCLF